MSGHSKWHNIQKRKGAVDAKRGNLFAKLAKGITVAAREAGGDVSFNFRLRVAVDAAKAVNMPKDNIDRAIKRGTGTGADRQIEEVIYEGFGPGGAAILIVCLTDNRTRTVAEVKRIVSKLGGTVGSQGSVMWMFDYKGVVSILNKTSIKDREELDMSAIDAGAEDLREEGEGLQIICSIRDLPAVTQAVEAQGIKPDGAQLEYLAKECTVVSDPEEQKQLDTLLEALDENDDVDAVYTNAA
ncbi:TPA: YebC/PmpR family DNA-binding transcriptional regulator [Candidatus Uhrbacteria bacterium]|uniref:Probable transcriptional regulatory protein UX57_C0021G0004 n=2 Tax=Candidatus Uhriibacteriota TaxID=1752732 RepID=A0A0G1Q604_9BACT|nr:MAG: transcriptional regulator [Candidatus Uhrbacteria bacterium GW2011_GWF2_46_218]KKU40272.1 MAG: transcriptional regulator [Candidatus Uhrbacteria bacterium GW2011_GWE2_46_68]HBK34319.1 YebC/PmpR family DNA-binding transcriptional regulator [Candidatus Uhrbacteria bacterium]HCB19075.1 YebC/PmpR family DNA-binding transcriptional regulator [Candidatus Uhrbacteria bacterium]